MKNNFLLTIDVDWAKDSAIEKTMKYLIERKVKCTWFITHDSKAIRKLFSYPELFEVGIHPNFLEGSTQGNNKRDIVSNLLKIAPNAVSFRTHALYQSTPLLKMLREEFNLKNDCSLLLPGAKNLTKHKIYFSNKNKPLTRFPYLWEDDIHLYTPNAKPFNEKNFNFKGLKIFTFHPEYIVKNNKIKSFFRMFVNYLSKTKTYTIEEYNEIKQRNE